MQNEMRDRLVGLLFKPFIQHKINELSDTGDIADHLIENGVIVPPCKVGDVVYVIMETSCEDIDGVYTTCEFYNLKSENLCTLPKGKCPYRYRIAECYVTEMNLLSFADRWGKTVFLTKEESEQELQKGGVK